MTEAILFDMDGVLVDTEEYICEAAIAMFDEMGVKTYPQDYIPFVGAGENRYVGGVAEKYGIITDIEILKKRTYEIYDKITKGKLTPLPGVIEFIGRCKKSRLKLAVATSADKTKMEINLREAGLSGDLFDILINGLDVERKKPFPDIYLLAAKEVGADIEKCVVVEDAVNGVQAAKAAGAKCLGLTTSFTIEQLSDADWVVKDLSYVDDKLFNEIVVK